MVDQSSTSMTPDLPTFETWTHENLAKFASEAYFKIAQDRINAAMPIPEWLK